MPMARAQNSCAPLPLGLVSWWRAEGDANDEVGGNNGTLLNGAVLDVGEVGQGFRFDGARSTVFIPASSNLDVGLGNGFTMEAWVNADDITGSRPMIEWSRDPGGAPYGVHFWLAHPTVGPGSIFANIVDTNGAWHVIQSLPDTIAAGIFQHVAVTYEKISGLAVLYVDGAEVVRASLGSFTPQTSDDLYLGQRPPGDLNSSTFSGVIDEVSVYNRAV